MGRLTQGSIGAIRTQTFTASGTYTPHANMVYCTVEMVGGGGAGGGVTGAVGNSYGGGGGGSGGYSRSTLTRAQVGASQVVTVGAAGVGVSGDNDGGPGGDTSLGALVIAKGGLAGKGNPTNSGIAVAGALAGTGDFVIRGGPGGAGRKVAATESVVNSGVGASSELGTGGPQQTTGGAATAGLAGLGYGGGGSGAAVGNNNTTSAAGGNGVAGVIIITEFCSS